MVIPLTKKELVEWAKSFSIKEKPLFCPYCCSKLETTKEGTYYCPNEMCLNEDNY